MAAFAGLRDFLGDLGRIGPVGWITGSGNVQVRDFPIEGFTHVQVGSAVQLRVTRGDSFQVSVEADDNLWDRLRVDRFGDTLRIEMEPGFVFRRATVRASITMPRLLGLVMSGATNGTIGGFSSAEGFGLQLSGASTLEGEIRSGDMTAELGGASRVTLTGSAERLRLDAAGGSQANLAALRASDVEVRASGASRTILTGSAGQLRVDASGGSHVSVTGVQVTDAEVRLGGASNATASGSATRLRVDASGGSHANLPDLQVVDAEVRLGGASSATLSLSGRLDASASGGSHVRYTGQPKLGRQSVSGGSSIRAK